MGIFDFFSEPPPLEERFKNALSVHLSEDERVLEKLARAQTGLLAELAPNEELLLITHGDLSSMNGFGIITTKRVISFKGKVDKYLLHSEIADINAAVHPSGNFIVRLIGREAAPYQQFSFDEMHGNVQNIWVKNVIFTSMPTAALQSEFLGMLELAKQLPA